MALFEFVKTFKSHTEWQWAQGTCGHCDAPTNFAIVALCRRTNQIPQGVAVCPACHGVNIVEDGKPQIPASRPGKYVEGLPEDVAAAWREARASLGAGAPTAAEHMCRKILVHIAVANGAKEGVPFKAAVEHLLATGVITSQWKPWVDKIRDNGNEAAHDLAPVPQERARLTLEFTQQLLQLVYETEHRMKKLSGG